MDDRTIPQGMATVSVWADDVAAAAAWYREVFGIEPYFVRPEAPEPPQYIEFRVGPTEDEFGIVDRRFGPPASAAPAGALLYWHVDDPAATLDRLVALGASVFQPVMDREDGFVTAAVVDPFGNLFGVMRNPHFAEIVAR